MFITNGVIKYGETRKIADFENKRADVELSFTAPEDEATISVFIDRLQSEAKRRVKDMLGIAPKPEHLVSTALQAQPEEQAKPAKVHNKRAPKMPVAENTEVIHRATAELDLATGVQTVSDPAAMVEPAPVEMPSTRLIPSEAVITDADLLDATSKRQQDVKNPVAIRKIMNDLGVKTPPGRLVDLAQDKRQEYLDRLKDIKPLA